MKKININNNSIGIFDSGVGGLSILKAIQKLMPRENFIYVADTQYVPYGNKSEKQIEARVIAIAEHLVSQNVKAIVIACNTATAAAVNQLRNRYHIPIIGLEPALKPATENTLTNKIGVLATQSTLGSQKYQDLKQRLGDQFELVEKASPLFVELVENSPTITPKEKSLIEKELAPFKQAKVDSLVLGCTHYPFLKQVIAQVMGEDVTIFESGLPVAKEVKRRLVNNLNQTESGSTTTYFSSEPQAAMDIFETILGEKVELNLL